MFDKYKHKERHNTLGTFKTETPFKKSKYICNKQHLYYYSTYSFIELHFFKMKCLHFLDYYSR